MNVNDGRVVPLLPEQREEIVVGESIVIINHLLHKMWGKMKMSLEFLSRLVSAAGRISLTFGLCGGKDKERERHARHAFVRYIYAGMFKRVKKG